MQSYTDTRKKIYIHNTKVQMLQHLIIIKIE